jgi:shikimate kinase
MRIRQEGNSNTNIVLIGMPGAGKSTVGVLLAKALSRDFLDTDVYIQAREGRTLQEIIDQDGLEFFRRIEERHVRSLKCRSSVIATGGSVVYYPAAMAHLRASGLLIHLDLGLPVLRKRLINLPTRGVVRVPGQSLAQLFAERQPLYRTYAHLAIDCSRSSHEDIVRKIVRRVNLLTPHRPRERGRTGRI